MFTPTYLLWGYYATNGTPTERHNLGGDWRNSSHYYCKHNKWTDSATFSCLTISEFFFKVKSICRERLLCCVIKNVALLFRVSFNNSEAFLLSFCEWPQSEALQATPVWHCHSHSAWGNNRSWINVRTRMFFVVSFKLWYWRRWCACSKREIISLLFQPTTSKHFFMYCLFSMNFNFLKKKRKKKQIVPKLQN